MQWKALKVQQRCVLVEAFGIRSATSQPLVEKVHQDTMSHLKTLKHTWQYFAINDSSQGKQLPLFRKEYQCLRFEKNKMKWFHLGSTIISKEISIHASNIK